MTDLPNINPACFDTIDPARLLPARRSTHAPRILLLYGSLRERSFSRFAIEEAARLLTAFGAEPRIFDPRGLPMADAVEADHPKVAELRDLVGWCEGMAWCSPERHGAMTGVMKTQVDWIPLSLGGEGTARIGGNLSTNAGGTGVLRYGTARELALGLEVVLPDGRLWDGLKGLRKDNSGYDLKQLFIGAEGTLGVITAAVLKLYSRPGGRQTALCGLPTDEDALALFGRAQAQPEAKRSTNGSRPKAEGEAQAQARARKA